MLQAITHTITMITHKISDSRTYKKLIQKLIQSLIQNSDSNETITLDFVRCFSVNITLSSLDLDDQSWWTHCWHEKPRWFASWRFDEGWMKLFELSWSHKHWNEVYIDEGKEIWWYPWWSRLECVLSMYLHH